jgi:hypothetical protein
MNYFRVRVNLRRVPNPGLKLAAAYLSRGLYFRSYKWHITVVASALAGVSSPSGLSLARD